MQLTILLLAAVRPVVTTMGVVVVLVDIYHKVLF
jgi:hypothetical protein